MKSMTLILIGLQLMIIYIIASAMDYFNQWINCFVYKMKRV